MPIKYLASYKTITKIEILRETAKQVVLLPYRIGGQSRRENKHGTYSSYFDTWEQAHDFFLANAQNEVTKHKKRLESVKNHLTYVEQMAKP